MASGDRPAVPRGLELILLKVAVTGLAELERSNGGLPASAWQLREWLATLAASADGNALRTLRPPPPPAAAEPCDTATAAAVLSITARQVRNLIADGWLNGRRVGRTWLLDRRQVDDLERTRNGNR